jgi:hypothetical protein
VYDKYGIIFILNYLSRSFSDLSPPADGELFDRPMVAFDQAYNRLDAYITLTELC